MKLLLLVPLVLVLTACGGEGGGDAPRIPPGSGMNNLPLMEDPEPEPSSMQSTQTPATGSEPGIAPVDDEVPQEPVSVDEVIEPETDEVVEEEIGPVELETAASMEEETGEEEAETAMTTEEETDTSTPRTDVGMAEEADMLDSMQESDPPDVSNYQSFGNWLNEQVSVGVSVFGNTLQVANGITFQNDAVPAFAGATYTGDIFGRTRLRTGSVWSSWATQTGTLSIAFKEISGSQHFSVTFSGISLLDNIVDAPVDMIHGRIGSRQQDTSLSARDTDLLQTTRYTGLDAGLFDNGDMVAGVLSAYEDIVVTDKPAESTREEFEGVFEAGK